MNSEPIALPHAVGAEKAVVSILLQYPEKLDDAPHLTADHFYQPNVRKLFEIIAETVHKGEAVELVSLTQSLADRGQLAAIGGPGFMYEIFTYQPEPGHFENHLEILTGKLACRMAIKAADEIKRVAFESPEPSELIAISSTPITAIHDTLTSNRPTQSTRSIVASCFKTFEKRCRGEESAMGIETSIPEINHLFRGLHPRQNVVISGYPSGGKTLLSGQLVMDAAMSGTQCAVLLAGDARRQSGRTDGRLHRQTPRRGRHRPAGIRPRCSQKGEANETDARKHPRCLQKDRRRSAPDRRSHRRGCL